MERLNLCLKNTHAKVGLIIIQAATLPDAKKRGKSGDISRIHLEGMRIDCADAHLQGNAN